MENLPTDIMEDILSRLPARPTLLQCKRVSKTWRELLKKYKYKIGMLFAYKSGGNTQLYYGDQDKVTLESFYSNKTLARYEHVQLRYEHVESRYEPVEFKYRHNHDNYIVGSCNGLVCLRSGICNPVTGEFLSFSGTRPIFSLSRGIGFGYLLSTNEYKVVSISSSNGKQRQGHHVHVYTLGSQSGWRQKKDTIPYDFDKPGIFANGAIHWMCNTAENGRGQQYKISVFDLEDEKFKGVPTPPLYNPYPWQNEYVELMLLGGNLCIVHHMRTHKMIDIWVFRRNTACISSSTPKCGDYYDKTWSWSVAFRIPETIGKPFAITENNEVLTRSNKIPTWRHHQQLYCYNANTSTITKSWDCRENTTPCVRAIPHVNTLVSLNELGE